MSELLTLSVGIIGHGKFGMCLENFFRLHEHHVIWSDTEEANADVIKNSEIVIFAVPIQKATEVIRNAVELAKNRDGSWPNSPHPRLWFDVTSVKVKPCEALQGAPDWVETAGTHPMFAPTNSRDWAGQTVVVCPLRLNYWRRWLTQSFLLDMASANMKIMSPEEHDKKMAVVQALPHAAAIAIARTILELGIDPKEIWDVASPFYKIVEALMGRILNQSPVLYGGIQEAHFGENGGSIEALKIFEREFREVTRSQKTFTDVFLRVREHFGKTGKEGFELFEKLIKTMRE